MAAQSFSAGRSTFLRTEQLSATGRVTRSPQHTFHIQQRPFAITPFMIAPVMPGETMVKLLMQARVVSDPIANPLIGWWQEYYWFYVKHRDLDDRDELTQMMLDPAWTIANIDSATAVPQNYFFGNATVPQVDWVQKCLKRVVEEFFRSEGEAWNDFMVDGLPAATYNMNSWLDSIDLVRPSDNSQDINVDANSDSYITAAEVEGAMEQWRFQQMQGLTEMSYEDWLATYGIRAPSVEVHRPELVRYSRTWSYPSNTVNPSTGAPTSAMSWSIAENAEKPRFFKEPGFLFGVSVSRPKIYQGQQRGAAVALLQDWATWLPAAFTNDRAISLREMAAAGGIIKTTGTTDFQVDVRDLFLYGDQFINFVMATGTADTLTTGHNLVPSPKPDAQWRYPENLTDVSEVFKTNTSPTAWVRSDGIVTLNIKGRQIDQT